MVSFQEYLAGTISFERFGHFCVISSLGSVSGGARLGRNILWTRCLETARLMGQVIPEVCVLLGFSVEMEGAADLPPGHWRWTWVTQ